MLFAANPALVFAADSPIRVLIVDGYSNHDWRLTTGLIRGILEPTGLFQVEVSTAPPTKDSPGWDAWRPKFADYDVVIQTCNDLGGRPSWPAAVRGDFETFVRNGGGVYVWHAGNNAFADWPAYNEMIGLGWRKKDFGWALAVDAEGKTIRIPAGEGGDTGHGARVDTVVKRLGDHPIHAGLPRAWLTPDIEIYYYARGPAQNIEVLSHGHDPRTQMSWPLEWTVRYGKGRVYTSTFGHVWKGDIQPDRMRCAGLHTVVVRALQWLAGREPDLPVPVDFPTADRISLRGELPLPAGYFLPAGGARLSVVALDGFAGSSINVLANSQHTLVTHGDHQYAAYYAADSTVVLARRPAGRDNWTLVRTSLKGRTADAHNTIALAVDGDGYLHLAWDHHNNALNYARSVAPGSLELAPREAMSGKLEQRVTYPAFLNLPDGDLLCFYRDGASGRGNLVLNRYRVKERTWTQVHASLIDGEGVRSAYPAYTVDAQGTLHLAWVWRASPDVATNQDIAYARSADGGSTWNSVDGRPLTVPFTAAGADYALRVGPKRSLMNPPSLAVDAEGRPLIANYWTPDGSDIPQFHLLHRADGRWHTTQVTQRTTPFILAGASTKRPPISRAVLTTRASADGKRGALLVFRDDERGSRIVAASCEDLKQVDWRFTELTAGSVGAWEPSVDPIAWARTGELQLLVQQVIQRDGNDREAAAGGPTPVSVLSWKPDESVGPATKGTK